MRTFYSCPVHNTITCVKFFFLLFQITLGGIVMLRDTAESQDGPEELIEPLKGTNNTQFFFCWWSLHVHEFFNPSVAVLV